MDTLEFITIEAFSKNYYKALLPLEKINAFLSVFDSRELEIATNTLISLFDTALTKAILANLHSTEQKQEFLRLIQDDYSSPTIMDYLIELFPNSEKLIMETLERTLLSAKKAIL